MDPRIPNKSGKTAGHYLNEDPQLIAFYESYGDGIWEAVQTSNVDTVERLIKGENGVRVLSPDQSLNR